MFSGHVPSMDKKEQSNAAAAGKTSPVAEVPMTSAGEAGDAEAKERQQDEWKAELAKTEEEIETLRRVLQAKIRTANELKRNLGISVWDEFRKDVNEGLYTVRESDTMRKAYEKMGDISETPVYQKAAYSLEQAKEKSATLFHTFNEGITKRMGDLKSSTAFKSFEEKAGEVYHTVKGKVGLDGADETATSPATDPANGSGGFEEVLNSTSPTK